MNNEMQKIATAYIDGSSLHSTYQFIKMDANRRFGTTVNISLNHEDKFKANMIVSCNKKANKKDVIIWFKRYCSHAVIESL